jgi:putative endonuclease
MGWHVYILRCRDGTLYTGIAIDLRRRLEAHERGVAAKYTRSRRPIALAYQEPQPDRSSALKREAGLRRLGRAGKLALIQAHRFRSSLTREDARRKARRRADR